MTKVLLFLLLLVSYVQGVIVEAPNLEIFEQALENCDEKTLVLLDVDDTLIEAKDAILQTMFREQYFLITEVVFTDPAIVLAGKYSPLEMLGLIFSQMEYRVVDEKLIPIVQNLQKKKIKTIAFTKMQTGSLGCITSLADWRIEHLKKSGFDFHSAIQNDFDLNIGGQTALFKGGVLFCNRLEKGPVLRAFLDKLDWRPTKILFLDDRLDFLQSVNSSITDIEFIGFHFREVENRKHSIDLELAHYQMRYLATTGTWLSDDEASSIKRSPKE